MLSDTSVEGVTWMVGYKGKGPYALLKYAVSKRKVKGVMTYREDKSNNLLHELAVGLILNKLLQYTSAFMVVYTGFLCSMPLSSNPSVEGISINYKSTDMCASTYSKDLTMTLIAELAHKPESFYDFLLAYVKQKMVFGGVGVTFIDVMHVFLQILSGLSVAYYKYKFVHGDLHSGNVLVSMLPSPTNVTLNVMTSKGQDQINLKNVRFSIKIIDYGRCKIDYNGTILSPLSFDNSGQDNIFSEPGNVENLIFGNNKFFPSLFDFCRVTNNLIFTPNYIKNISSTTDRKFLTYLSELLIFTISIGSTTKYQAYASSAIDAVESMCTKGAAYCFGGESNFDKYWKDVNASLSSARASSNYGTQIVQNTGDIAKLFYDHSILEKYKL